MVHGLRLGFDLASRCAACAQPFGAALALHPVLPMTGLTPAIRARLAACLALAEAAAHAPEGERLAALAAAERLLARHGLHLRDLPSLPAPEAALPERGVWRETCRQCLARRHLLRPWEIGFLTDLPRFRRLSVKQRYCLREIAERVLGEPPHRQAA